jgi:hypothetical protein
MKMKVKIDTLEVVPTELIANIFSFLPLFQIKDMNIKSDKHFGYIKKVVEDKKKILKLRKNNMQKLLKTILGYENIDGVKKYIDFDDCIWLGSYERYNDLLTLLCLYRAMSIHDISYLVIIIKIVQSKINNILQKIGIENKLIGMLDPFCKGTKRYDVSDNMLKHKKKIMRMIRLFNGDDYTMNFYIKDFFRNFYHKWCDMLMINVNSNHFILC